MYDTNITVLGNVATNPVIRQLSTGMLTEFRVASTSRRFDKRQEKWVDGDELFIKVSCWRGLAEHVQRSVHVGDPVMVRGRLYSRRHTDDNGGNSRYFYEINAQAVGHDLSRGVAQFARTPNRPASSGPVRDRSEFDALVDSFHESEKDSVPGESAPALAG